jgi:hypothetical protein
MKTVYALMLTSLTAVSASAGHTAKMRDRLVFCEQFVIADAYPAVRWPSAQYCCGAAPRVHDCRTQDWYENDR